MCGVKLLFPIIELWVNCANPEQVAKGMSVLKSLILVDCICFVIRRGSVRNFCMPSLRN
jgi:hypothetical protein